MFKTIGLHIYMYRDKVTQLHDIYDNRKVNRTFRKYLIKHLTTTIYYIHTLYSCMHEYIPGVKDFSKQNKK